MKKKLLNSMRVLLVAALLGGASSAWAAGYTRTLTEELTVAGYKAKAFYDFQSNSPEVLPTSGELRYRDGGIWGLHNFGSGTRSATATIPVLKNGILVLQHYSSIVSTINRGTLNSTLTSSTGYEVYDITADADDITFTIARYGGIIAALVMEKDNSATTADYTVNYKVNGVGENVKTTEGNTVVGSVVYAETSFFVDDVKYVLNGDQTTSMTIVDGTNALNINVKEADKYTYTVNAIINGESTILKQLAKASIYSDESVKVPYPAYIYNGGTLYSCAATSNEYRKSFTITENEQVATIAYSVDAITNAVFYSEGEDLSGVTINTTGTNVAIRASNAAAASIDGDVTICNLSAGLYTITLGMHHTKNNASVTTALTCGANNISISTEGTNRTTGISEVFKITKSTDLVMNSITGDGLIDYILIKKLPTSIEVNMSDAGWATLYTPYALDFTTQPGITAYTAAVADGKVTLTKVDNVPANTGVVLKGDGPSYYQINVAASSETAKGDLLGSATDATAYNAIDGYTLYMLKKVGEKAQFVPVTSGSIAAGKAYLKIAAATARNLDVTFADEATGISAALMNKETMNNEVYNLKGQRVAAPMKGLYIVNGKKMVIK